MTDVVHCDLDAGIATITLNRPDSMNALTLALMEGLRATLESVAADSSVRAVVLTGAGRAFCAGQDLTEHASLLETTSADALADRFGKHVAANYAPVARLLTTMPKPAVAAVNGIAAGAGASLAFACDFRLASETAGFNLAFSSIGLPADTGATWTLPRLVGRAKALELLMLPSTVAAAEAMRHGLVHRVVPADDLATEAASLARRLADGATIAYGAIKRALAYSAVHSLEETLAYEGEMMALCGVTEDHRNAVAAFLRKEKPAFHAR